MISLNIWINLYLDIGDTNEEFVIQDFTEAN